MKELPAPALNDLNSLYWGGLAEGELRYPRCDNCGHAWLPLREECPRCLWPDWTLEVSSGRGTLVSWVVYHRAFHPYFTDRIPYHVAVVELAEGPRMITNLVLNDGEEPEIDQIVELQIEREGDWSLARFRLSR